MVVPHQSHGLTKWPFNLAAVTAHQVAIYVPCLQFRIAADICGRSTAEPQL